MITGLKEIISSDELSASERSLLDMIEAIKSVLVEKVKRLSSEHQGKSESKIEMQRLHELDKVLQS